jgi:acyl-coenzyme A thioesterase PaaI-like protein
VLALSVLNGRFRNCTTVDLTTHFLRPMMLGDVEVTIEAMSNGRRMAVTRSEFRSAGSAKLGATATCAFAYLED